MLFGRKNPAPLLERIRVSLWPRRSWSRSAKYVSKRIMRLTASPHAVSAGVAVGVFASFTPFIGFHFIIAFILAYCVAGNFLAAALGTFFGNPATFPIIWASTYKLGTYMVSGVVSEHHVNGIQKLTSVDFWGMGINGVWEMVVSLWQPLVFPMLVGAIPLGLGFGLGAYFVTRFAISTFREAQLRKRIEKTSKNPAE